MKTETFLTFLKNNFCPTEEDYSLEIQSETGADVDDSIDTLEI